MMGEGRERAAMTAVEDEGPEAADRLRLISAVSLAALAIIAAGAALFMMRELLLPIVTAACSRPPKPAALAPAAR